MSVPTYNERTPLISSGDSYQQPALGTIQVDPAVLARTMQILSNQMAANQRPQPPAPPIANAAVQQSLSLQEGQYVGDVKDGLPDGRGMLTYHPGSERSSYEGTWLQGKFHGRGILRFANGAEHQGQWENGLLHGRGIKVFSNGDRYEGGFLNDQYHGHGTLRWINGQVYEGGWKNGKRDGQGTYTWPNGSKYIGEWRNSKRNGQGKETQADGDYYDGEWLDDKRHGKGTRRLNHFNYNGIWRQDQFWSGAWAGTTNGIFIKGNQIDGVRVSNNCCTIL